MTEVIKPKSNSKDLNVPSIAKSARPKASAQTSNLTEVQGLYTMAAKPPVNAIAMTN